MIDNVVQNNITIIIIVITIAMHNLISMLAY